MEELQSKILAVEKAHEEAAKKQNEEQRNLKLKMETVKARMASIEALEPEELKKCFAVGVVKKGIIVQMEEYLKRYPDVFSKTVKMSRMMNPFYSF